MKIDPTLHVADLVTRYPATLCVFQRHGIEFCCGGRKPLELVCTAHGLELDELLAELEASLAEPAPELDWRARPLSELVDHIVERYHRPLPEELERIRRMADRVLERHGASDPERLHRLAEVVRELSAELEMHLFQEERALFPAIKALEAESLGSEAVPARPLALETFEQEHDEAGRALAEIRALTANFRPPADACNTYRGLYDALARLEQEMHLHVHLENHVLFPRAAQIGTERSPAGAAPPRA